MPEPEPLSALDFHVLLVLAEDDLYGYALMKAVEEESGGRIRPEVGSLYRILGRLMAEGLVAETSAPAGADASHRGRPRKYYRITARGREAARNEAARLEDVVALARGRDLRPRPGAP